MTFPESPDLNPIENLWHDLKEFLRREVKPHNKQELVDGLLRYWKTRVLARKKMKGGGGFVEKNFKNFSCHSTLYEWMLLYYHCKMICRFFCVYYSIVPLHKEMKSE